MPMGADRWTFCLTRLASPASSASWLCMMIAVMRPYARLLRPASLARVSSVRWRRLFGLKASLSVLSVTPYYAQNDWLIWYRS